MSINSIFAGSTPHSRDTIRQQYLNTLALDIANMTKNLNANKLFKANGTTGSAPPDTRSATEKFADVEGLRQSVKSGLREITDPIEAENIVADITIPELEYLAQTLPFIVKDLKPKFALGVPAGSFLPYLRRMMRSNIENEGLAFGLTTAPNVAGGVASTGVEYMDKNEWRNLVANAQDLTTSGSEREKMKFSALMEKISSVAELTPTFQDREMVASLNDPDILDTYDELVAQVGQNLPTENDLERALQLPTLAQKNKTLSGLLDGVNLAYMRELQEYLDGVRDELYKQSVEAKLISSREQRFRESPEDFDARLASADLGSRIPDQQVPEGGDYTSPQSEALDILSRTPQYSGPQPKKIATQQDSPDLPDAYVSQGGVSQKSINAVVPPFKEQALPYDEYLRLGYEDKKEMLLQYADAGLFNDMDAGFFQMINALEEPYVEVPERAMDNEYRKFDRSNSLFRTEPNLDRGERGAEDLFFGDIKKRFETQRPMEDESGLGWAMEGEDPVSNPNKKTIGKRLQRGDYENYPDFKEVAELIVNTDRVEDDDIDNFLTAFNQIQQREAEEGGQMGAEDVNVGRKAVKAKKQPVKLVEELVSLEDFAQLSNSRKKDTLESLRDNREIDDIAIIRRINNLATAPRAETLNAIYDDLLISRGQVVSLKELPASAKAKKGSAESTEAEGRSPEKEGTTRSINAPTEELFATPQKATAEPPYPLTPSAFKGVSGGNDTRRAIIEKAFRDGVFEREPIAKKDKDGNETGDFIEISDATYQLAQQLFKNGDKIPEKTTSAVLLEAFKGIFPMLKEIKLLGMGLPAPHHVLGPNGYGLPHTLTSQGRPMYVGGGNGKSQMRQIASPPMEPNKYGSARGQMRQIQAPPMGSGMKKKMTSNDIIHIDFEKGSLPKGKKKGNIIFGMGLASVVPQPKVKVEGKNINLSAGIEAEPAYVKFGTHLLNKHRLKDNVVMMRTMKGGAIVNIPTQKVSSKLSKILHTISGGGIPQFESVMDLTDGDKALLHQIAKTSKVSDRLSVPNPNKSKLEEEDNRFNILRGEVSIGNDNPAVIKEFKVLLLKFMREGRVPTGQGKAIMEELLLLGY